MSGGTCSIVSALNVSLASYSWLFIFARKTAKRKPPNDKIKYGKTKQIFRIFKQKKKTMNCIMKRTKMSWIVSSNTNQQLLLRERYEFHHSNSEKCFTFSFFFIFNGNKFILKTILQNNKIMNHRYARGIDTRLQSLLKCKRKEREVQINLYLKMLWFH